MKKTFLLITSLLIITSTVFAQSTVNINSLQEYGEKAFKVDDENGNKIGKERMYNNDGSFYRED